MKKIVFHSLLAIILSTAIAKAQDNDTTKVIATKIEVVKDGRIDALNKAYGSYYKLEGYRIQIYSGNKKQPARQARLEFSRIYRKTKAHESYEQPYFKVRVGDFKTKIEALKFKNELTKHFPNCFIVKDEIEFKDNN